jgi:hypothetical protein
LLNLIDGLRAKHTWTCTLLLGGVQDAGQKLLPHRRPHALFLKIQELLADASEILLRSDHADVALQGLADLRSKKSRGSKLKKQVTHE